MNGNNVIDRDKKNLHLLPAMESNSEPECKKRRMEPHVSGDDLTQDSASLTGVFSSKNLVRPATGSPSGDFSNLTPHQYVTFVSTDEASDGTEAEYLNKDFDVYKQNCDVGDAWHHKYPVPLSSFPKRPIRTGNLYYDGIISDLELLGYKPLQVIARGRSGTIILAQDLQTSRIFQECEIVPVALKLNSGKTKRKPRPWARNDMMDEMSIHRQLVHPNIVSWYDNFSYNGRVGTILEFCENGTLEQLIRIQEASRFLAEPVCRKYFRQIFSAVHYMHRLGFAHRDICLQNILITRNNTAKLSDFGHAVRYMDGDPLCIDECGTLGYQAPEVLERTPYNPKHADIWSLGALLHTMCIGRLPHGLINTEILLNASKRLRFPDNRIMPLSKGLKELLKGLLAYNPATRFTHNRIRLNDWMATSDNKVQIGNFYLIRQPQKLREGPMEVDIKVALQI